MAHFYASIEGPRKPKTCVGHKSSGIRAHIRGWDKGIQVKARYDEKAEADIFEVYQTGGSNGSGLALLLGTLNEHGVFVFSKFCKLTNEEKAVV